MKRLLLVTVLAGVFAAPAHAAVPCWKKVVNDWYGDGKIASTYPLHCYRDAKHHLRTDELVYSSLGDDIQRALAAAVARRAGKHVPAQVGKGFAPRDAHLASAKVAAGKARPAATASGATAAAPVASAETSSSGGPSLPLPLLVLGGAAILLIATGAIGGLVRRRRAS